MAIYDRELVSPSRTYAIFSINSLHVTDEPSLNVVTLPETCDNNIGGARLYYYQTINCFGIITSCIPVEIYEEKTLARIQADDRKIFLDKCELIERIKISLSKHYGRQILIDDSEVLLFLENLESDASRYMEIVNTIRRDLSVVDDEV